MFKNNCEFKFKLKDGRMYSKEQVAESVKRLNLLIDKDNVHNSFKSLRDLVKGKIG